jgi:HAE1 family hydrophobic/amphiphilic exporter-1
MTAFAFILGCIPLWTAAGSGSVSRRILGTTVIGGMLAATFVSIFLIPVLFYVVEKMSHRKSDKGAAPPVKTSQPVEARNKN